jgi:hypothetical protein
MITAITKKALFKTGLPDGFFSNRNSQFGQILEVGKYGYMYFMDIWNIYGHLGYFMTIGYFYSGFGIMYKEKSGNPGLKGDPVSTYTRYLYKV